MYLSNISIALCECSAGKFICFRQNFYGLILKQNVVKENNRNRVLVLERHGVLI